MIATEITEIIESGNLDAKKISQIDNKFNKIARFDEFSDNSIGPLRQKVQETRKSYLGN